MINARPPSITVIATITKHMLSRIVHKEEPLLQEEFVLVEVRPEADFWNDHQHDANLY